MARENSPLLDTVAFAALGVLTALAAGVAAMLGDGVGRSEAQTGSPDTVAAVSVTTSSTALVAVGRRSFVSIENVGTANPIACSFGGTAALNTAGSFQIAAGVTLKWGEGRAGADFTPTISQAIDCIAGTATTPATIEYH